MGMDGKAVLCVYDFESERRCIPMAYQISSDCISCGTCEGGCPVGAISQGDAQYVIAADACIDCGNCAENCPVGAISQG